MDQTYLEISMRGAWVVQLAKYLNLFWLRA